MSLEKYVSKINLIIRNIIGKLGVSELNYIKTMMVTTLNLVI